MQLDGLTFLYDGESLNAAHTIGGAKGRDGDALGIEDGAHIDAVRPQEGG